MDFDYTMYSPVHRNSKTVSRVESETVRETGAGMRAGALTPHRPPAVRRQEHVVVAPLTSIRPQASLRRVLAARRETTGRRTTVSRSAGVEREHERETESTRRYSFRINHSFCIAWLYLCDRCSITAARDVPWHLHHSGARNSAGWTHAACTM